jgi:aflatoxin B1 aldehyde reductase
VKVAAEHGISGHAASLRWVAFHSVLDQRLGDGIVVGASSIKQLEQNLDVFEQGPLPREVANAFSLIYGQLGEDKVPYSV